MRWPWRYQGAPDDPEGKEQAKKQLREAVIQNEVAHAIADNAAEARRVHEDIMRRNNLGPKIHKALGGN